MFHYNYYSNVRIYVILENNTKECVTFRIIIHYFNIVFLNGIM